MPMESYQPDPFLRESWERKKLGETGEESPEMMADRLLNQVELDARRDKELAKVFEAVKKDILRYKMTIERFKHPREEDTSSVEEMDRVRRMAHNRMVDDINLLSRQFGQKGLDNSWRAEMGTSNEQVGRWVERLESI